MSSAQTSRLTPKQLNAVIACFLGWTLDAFDFFVLLFVVRDIAKEFGTSITAVTVAVWLTLAMRPVGAFLFGMMADRFGRRPALMLDILCYSALEFRQRVCSVANRPSYSSRSFRYRYGRRMGNRFFLDDGKHSSRPRGESFPGFCKPATLPDTCLRRLPMRCCSIISAGVGCLWLA